MSAPIAPGRNDSPAVALGPTSLVLGALAAVGAWPSLMLAVLPWSFIAGPLAVTFGLAGMHYARQGIGRMWTAVAGTTLGAIGVAGFLILITALAA
ncbi:hypothetical protein AQI88_13530 [Streptomyces cellostaticus]|uniref:Uncharacterized protein n=1 Tax=Streptomyces cellostaticus TaxID=67285 RepID=A0A101NMM2_9ACTN|nr:hypothetical protein [Streptomyces cellostaticus]KUM96060.1 hypothetical protein AQI88_13530 [Streptomyces cellostaticus]GHI02363.1 hypothetical protein Scel_06840 [Streptomyces cellostaticus]